MTAPVRYQLKISGAFPGRKTAMVMVGLPCNIAAYEYVPAGATCTCAGRTGSTSTYAARAGCARTGDASARTDGYNPVRTHNTRMHIA